MPRVLVIDDDKSVCMAIESLLRQQDCVSVLAENGCLGAKAFRSSHFDLVMVDIFMPGMDGLGTIKIFREQAPMTPIVAMSGFRFANSSTAPAPDFLGMATKLGATYCLQKPFGPQQLLDAVTACLGEKSEYRTATG